MKFKKAITAVLVILLAICMVGCGETNTEAAVANNIEKSTTKLNTIIERLEEINYDDIIIDDITPLADSTFKTTSQTKAMQKSKWYAVGTGQSGTYQTSRLAGNKQSSNAKYVSTDKIDISTNQNRTKTKRQADRISHTNCENGNCYEYPTNNAGYTTQRTASSSYTPKYVNEVSNNFTRDALDSYLSQIEIVYNTCSDCISCNAECKNETAILKQNISDCKVLSGKLKDGTIKLSEQEINSCNSCLDDLQACSYKLNSTKDNVTIKEKDVTKLKDNFSKNLASLQNAYEKLLTAVESRLDYLKGCNDCIYSLFDIINKTNVNISAAEKNKSNQTDIFLNEERMQEETENNIYDNSILDSRENYSANQTKATNFRTNTSQKSAKRQNSQTNNNMPPKRPFRENYRPEVEQNQPNDLQKKTSGDGNQAQQNDIDTNQNQIYPNPAMNPNIANQYPNGWNYQNGYYGQNYPYGNRPYPPRNIDTYRNVIKNTDTYSPNYLPGNGTNIVPNSQAYNGYNQNGILPTEANLQNNAQTVNADVEAKQNKNLNTINLDSSKENEMENSNSENSTNLPNTEPLHSTENQNKIIKKARKIGANLTDMQKNSCEKAISSGTMQNNFNKLDNLNQMKLSAEEDVSEPIIVENELY